MRRGNLISILVFVVLYPLPAEPTAVFAGQEPQARGANSESAQPPQSSRSDSSDSVLTDGTPVRLRFTGEVDSSKVLAGDLIDLQVAEEVKTSGVTVIAKDAVAHATVVLAQAKQHMARSGNLTLRIDEVRLADGQTARLRAIKEVKGGDRTAALVSSKVVATAVIGSGAGLLAYVKGNDVVIEKDTEMTAYIHGDVKIDVAKFEANPGLKPPDLGKEH